MIGGKITYTPQFFTISSIFCQVSNLKSQFEYFSNNFRRIIYFSDVFYHRKTYFVKYYDEICSWDVYLFIRMFAADTVLRLRRIRRTSLLWNIFCSLFTPKLLPEWCFRIPWMLLKRLSLNVKMYMYIYVYKDNNNNIARDSAFKFTWCARSHPFPPTVFQLIRDYNEISKKKKKLSKIFYPSRLYFKFL